MLLCFKLLIGAVQMLEVIRLEGHSLAQDDAFVSRDIHLLQVVLMFSICGLRNPISLHKYVGY